MIHFLCLSRTDLGNIVINKNGSVGTEEQREPEVLGNISSTRDVTIERKIIRLQEGHYEDARALYEQALEHIDGDDSKALHVLSANIAQCNLQLKQYGKCIQWCDKALKLDGTLNDKLHYRRGMAFFHLQDFKSASKEFQHVVERNCNDKEAKNYRDQCLRSLETQNCEVISISVDNTEESSLEQIAAGSGEKGVCGMRFNG